MKKNFIALLLPLFGSVCLLNGAVIVQHTFDGGAGNLSTTDVDQVATGVDTTWLASSSFKGDGTITDPGSGTHRSASVGLGGLINAAKGDTNGIFTLTVKFASLNSGSGWLASGFESGAEDLVTSFTTNGLASTMWDASPYGEVKVYDGLGTGGTLSASLLGTDATGGVTFTTVLDLSGYNGSDNFGSITYSFNGGTATTSSFTAAQNFDNLQISAFVTGGSITSLELTQVPEPSTYALLGGLMALGLVMVRRRRTRS